MGIEISGWLGQVLVAAPYLLLALVIVLFAHRRGELDEAVAADDFARSGEPAGVDTRHRPGSVADDARPSPPQAVQPAVLPPPVMPPAIPQPAPAPPAASYDTPQPVVTAERPRQPPAAAPPAPAPPTAPSVAITPRPPAAQPPAAKAAGAAPAPAAASAPGMVPAEALTSVSITTSPPAAAPAPPRPPQQRTPSVEEVTAALERAIAGKKEGDVALLSLYLARRQKASGMADVGELLRRAVRISAQIGLKELQAEARLDLGEEARAAGDLTTACEHWQIARSLFEDSKQPAKAASVESHMKRFGCPTDWVLNDF